MFAIFWLVFALICFWYFKIQRRPPSGKCRRPSFRTKFSIDSLGTSLPPGPRGLPFIGHFLHMKDVPNPEILMKWRREYGMGSVLRGIPLTECVGGDIMSINVFGHRVVFVFSPDIARELFEKKGSIYSDRPPSHMLWS